MVPFHGRLAPLALLCLVQWVSGDYAFGIDEGSQPERFNLTLTWEDRVVAGFTRKAIVSNGQFPAPTLRLRQGDHVEFEVNNELPFSTTIHFHGEFLDPRSSKSCS